MARRLVFLYIYFLLILQRRVCRLYVCMFFFIFMLFIHYRANYSHSLLSCDGTRILRAQTGSASTRRPKRGNIVCTCIIPRDDSHEESVLLFPTVCVCFFSVFVLMSTPRSGLNPPSLALVWYIDVYYTETLSLVHWRLKYTQTKYVPCIVEFPKKMFFKYIFFSFPRQVKQMNGRSQKFDIQDYIYTLCNFPQFKSIWHIN